LRDAIPREIEAIFEHSGNEFLLSQSQAVRLGLVINELVTNSVKYAFPDRPDGRIAVRIHEHLGDCCVRVSDNGCGFGGEAKGTGEGTKLLKALTQELGGVFDLRSSKDGTTAWITFPISSATSSSRRDEGLRATLH
jgi:chemotaxis protein methyltransferase CheR